MLTFTRSVLRLLLPALLCTSTVSSAATRAEIDTCLRLLTKRVDQERFSKWEKLPEALTKLKRATLLVRLSLSKASPRLSYAFQLTDGLEGVELPDELRVLHGDNLVFVAHGESAGLKDLYERIASSPARDFASFRVLDARAARDPLILPERSIPLDPDGDVKGANAKITDHLKQGTGFAVYNVREDLEAFVVPRAQMPEEVNSVFLKQQRVSVQSVPTDVKSLATWLLARAKPLNKKMIYLFEKWAVVSPSAFRTLYELARLDTSRLPAVDEQFQSALADCFGYRCEDLPQSTVVGTANPLTSTGASADVDVMTARGRARVLAFLRAHRGEVPLTRPDGIGLAFVELARLIPDPQAARTYLAELRAIEFMPSEYNLLFTSKVALDRFTRAWRAFLKAMANPFAESTFTTRNIQKAISAIPEE